MNYNDKIRLKDITKFNIWDYSKKPYNNNLSNIFWSNLFDKKNLKSFLFNKYIPSKKNINSNEMNEILFFYNKINEVKKSINCVKKKNIKPENLFFAFITFEKIISYYNDYYKDSNIQISLLKWLNFNINHTNIEEIYWEISKKWEKFINELIRPIIIDFLEEKNENRKSIYLFEIFWPEEIINILIFASIIKYYEKDSVIVLDLSKANEQYDFTKWTSFFKENVLFFSKYIDFVIPNKDFWNSFNNLYSVLNGSKNNILSNLISLTNEKFHYYEWNSNIQVDEIDDFIKNLKNPKLYEVFWKKTYFFRMFPYKCYWSKCTFCTINAWNNIKFNSQYSYDFFIDIWIDFIKKNNIEMIVFWDEAISPLHIEKFANKIIDNEIKIIYQFRTRFDKKYTKKLCDLLYKSWARYCWIWLESASYRINEEIWNKWEKHITNKDKLEIIHSFDQAWISFHNYAIIWFPTETKLESIATYNFLIKNIDNSNHYTCTPNIFWLMKWSEIFSNPEKYNIKIEENTLNNPINLNYDFKYLNWDTRPLYLYNSLAEKIHQKQFTPWLIWKNYNNAKWYWDFIDRSSYFYKMKMLYNKNPYINYMNINNIILKKDINTILNTKYSLSIGLKIEIQNNELAIYDYINMFTIVLEKKYYIFFKNYKWTLTLIENLNNNNIWEIDNFLIIKLIENRLLIIKKW